MKVLYISYDGMTDSLGQSQVIPYLLGLSEKGYQITLVSCEKKNKFESKNSYIQSILSKSGITWFPVPYSTLPSVLSKRLNIYRIKKTADNICTNYSINVIHCRSYMASLIGIYLKNKFGLKFIFDMRGFWADERIEGGIWDLNNKLHKGIYNYFKRKEIEFLTNADYTISLTKNAKDEILSWKPFQNKEIPIETIPCCTDLTLFSNANINSNRRKDIQRELGISADDFIITYLGSIGTWYMLNEMLDFFKILLKHKSNAKFLFITPDKKGVIELKAITKGIPSEKIIISSANRNDVPLFLSLSKLSIYFIKPTYSKKASSPTKTGEIMAMGIPIITNSGIGDSNQIINDSCAGLLINEFTNEEYQKTINQIDVLLETDKESIVKAAENYFSLDKGIELYDNVYKRVLKINK